ncbi:MAG: hypothetical protein IH796_00355 [Deltaproteobacteria bacterium]|nr:hypothetical protein [Deltaproteobacteria bacterium]
MHFTIVGYGVMYWGSRARELGNLASLMGRFDEAEEHLELAADATLEPGGEFAAPWSLALASDCPITSKTGGLFLLYGERWERPGRFGKLDLRVTLAPVVEAYLATLENVFSFVAASCRFDGAFTEVRLKPPSRYATLERPLCSLMSRSSPM